MQIMLFVCMEDFIQRLEEVPNKKLHCVFGPMVHHITELMKNTGGCMSAVVLNP